jgi:hypothetical protein
MEVESFFALLTLFSFTLAALAAREQSFASRAAFQIRRLEHIRSAFRALHILQLGLRQLGIEPNLGDQRTRVSGLGVRAFAAAWEEVIALFAFIAINRIDEVVTLALASDVEPVILVSTGGAG